MMKKTNVAASAAALGLVLMFYSGHAVADDGWESSLTISVMQSENRLSFGQKPDATDGVDGKYEVPAMLAGDVKAYFVIDHGSYWRDIRSSGMTGSKTWDLKIESSLKKMISITWKSSAIPKGITARLLDTASGSVIDMAVQSSYNYLNPGAASFQIEAWQDSPR